MADRSEPRIRPGARSAPALEQACGGGGSHGWNAGSGLALGALAAVVIVLVLILAAALRPRIQGPGEPRGGARFCGGPYNLQLYDAPFRYPYYEARSANRWDLDKRCVAFCQQSPCALWCR